MVNFFSDPECTQPLTELRFDDSYVEDIYGGILENVLEVGSEVRKTIYAKNFDADIVVIKSVSVESPFVTAIVQSPRLAMGEVTPISVTFKPTIDELNRVNAISDEAERTSAKEKLLKPNIHLSLYRITKV